MSLNETGPAEVGVDAGSANPGAAQVDDATLNPNPSTQDGGGDEQTADTKTFTQTELNDIVKKEKARAEARAERRVLKLMERFAPGQQPAATQQPTQQGPAKPMRAQFADDDAYTDALVDWKLDQRNQQGQAQRDREHQEATGKKTAAIYAEASKVPGFDRETFDELPMTPAMAHALVESDQTARLMAFLCEHPEEVERMAALSPARQAAEMGKLEAKLPPVSKTSKAPAPINPIGGRGAGPTGDPARMSMEEYIAYRTKQGARWAR